MARDEGGKALNRAHRRRFLLSGLLVCGMCGGGYTIMGKDRYGCAAQGNCGNDRTIGDQAIEGRVLTGLKHHLLTPELFEASAKPYQEECAVLARSAVAEWTGLHGRLAKVERKIMAMIRAIEDGLYQPAMKEQMTVLEAEKAQLVTELAVRPDATPIALHPNLPLLYRKKVEELEAVLADPGLGPEAMDAIRAMIVRIVLKPAEEGGMEAVLEGDLVRILKICAGAEHRNPRLGGGRSGTVLESKVSVVAGARNHLNLLFDAPELRRWARNAAIQASGIFDGARWKLYPSRHGRPVAARTPARTETVTCHCRVAGPEARLLVSGRKGRTAKA